MSRTKLTMLIRATGWKSDLYSRWDVVDYLYGAAVWMAGKGLRDAVYLHLALRLRAGLFAIDCLARGALQAAVLSFSTQNKAKNEKWTQIQPKQCAHKRIYLIYKITRIPYMLPMNMQDAVLRHFSGVHTPIHN